MFEQSVLSIPRRPWTVAASLTLQCAAIGTIVLVSVISVQSLPSVTLPTPLPPLPRAPRPDIQVIASSLERSTSVVIPGTAMPKNIFREPGRIPTKISMIDDGSAALAWTAPAGTGTGNPDGVVGAFAYDAAHQMPPPPEPPKQALAKKQPEPSTPSKPVEVGGRVQEAKLVHRVMPAYPPLARQARISGQVRLVAVISRDGTVKELQVLGGHPLLVPSAVDAVRQWVYSPTLLNGRPVEVIAPVDVNFTLSGGY